MRIFLIVLFLIIGPQPRINADDIRDFEIEGISIGDSLLDHANINNINSNLSNSEIYKGTSYQRACFDNYGNVYDRICATFSKNTKKTIQAVQGQVRFEPLNYELCKKKNE